MESLLPPPPLHDTGLTLKEVQTPFVPCQQGQRAWSLEEQVLLRDRLPDIAQVAGGHRLGMDNLMPSHLFGLPTRYQR